MTDLKEVGERIKMLVTDTYVTKVMLILTVTLRTGSTEPIDPILEF